MVLFHLIFTMYFPALFYSKVLSQLQYRCPNHDVFRYYKKRKKKKRCSYFKNNSRVIIGHRSSDFISWPKRNRFNLIQDKSFSALFPAFLQSYCLLIHSRCYTPLFQSNQLFISFH